MKAIEPIFPLFRAKNDERLLKSFLTQASEGVEACDVKNISRFDHHWPPGRDTHEMGGCRMGKDPAVSKVNGNNQFHHGKTVFVTDGPG
jgi:choline dehydrogenase-like flavoprotein